MPYVKYTYQCPGGPNIGSFRFVIPLRACDALSCCPKYASVSTILYAVVFPFTFRTRYLPSRSFATFGAGRRKKLEERIFRIKIRIPYQAQEFETECLPAPKPAVASETRDSDLSVFLREPGMLFLVLSLKQN